MRDGVMSAGRPPECAEAPPVLAASEAANDMRMSRLVRTIETRSFPVSCSRTGSRPSCRVVDDVSAGISHADVEHFAKLMLANDEEPSFEAVMSYRARGVSIEKLYLDLLAPAARYLGELWNEDLCTFTDVTVGLGRLQRVLRELSPAFGSLVDHPGGRPQRLAPAVSGRAAHVRPRDRRGILPSRRLERERRRLVLGRRRRIAGRCRMVRRDRLLARRRDPHRRARRHHPHRQARILQPRDRRASSAVLCFRSSPSRVEAVGADGMTMDGRDAPRSLSG